MEEECELLANIISPDNLSDKIDIQTHFTFKIIHEHYLYL